MYSHDRYDQLVAETFQKIVELGQLKGAEYAGDSDRLLNFRRNGEKLGLPMEVIWAVYVNKHLDAIMQYCQDQVTGKVRTRLEGLKGRVDDAIVYLLLFKAMLDERGREMLDSPTTVGGIFRGIGPAEQDSDQ